MCSATANTANLLRSLWRSGTIRELARAGLLPEFEPLRTGSAAFSLQTRVAPVLLAPAEWCGRLWQAAAGAVISLLGELYDRELTLASIRPEFVILGDACRPVYARPGAIVPATPGQVEFAIAQFAEGLLLPYFVSLARKSLTLRAVLSGDGVPGMAIAFPELAVAAREACAPSGGSIKARLRDLANVVAQPLQEPDTFWSRYEQGPQGTASMSSWPYKNQAVERILATTAPASVLDLASNSGWYAVLAAKMGARVVAVDRDETCVNRIFGSASEGALNIAPAIVDITRRSELHAPVPRERLTAQTRFASEFVLALAIVHHLILAPPRLDLDGIAGLLAGFTTKYLLTEFVSFDPESHNPYRPDVRPDCTPWYTLDHFLAALGRKFGAVVVVPGPAGRRLVLAEK